MNVLYRVSLPRPLPSHRLLLGSVLAAAVFLVTTLGLRVYLTWITGTGYTYGALATPIAFLLFAFFLGFAIMIGAELNAAVQEEWPAPVTHAHRLRRLARGAGRVAQGRWLGRGQPDRRAATPADRSHRGRRPGPTATS